MCAESAGLNARRLVAGVAIVVAALIAPLLAAGASHAATVTISPLEGTRDASPQTQISFLGAAADQIRDISVVGSSSGAHSGRLESYASAVGASFLPSHPFVAGERVSVRASIGHTTASTSFTVAHVDAYDYMASARSSQAPPAPGQSFVSAPTLQPPLVSIDYDSPEAAPGDVFLTFAHGAGQSGPMIVNPAGQLVWFTPVPHGMTATDLQVERYEGKPALVWWQGYIPHIGIGFGTDEIYGSNYRQLAQVKAGNGYMADLHDIQITPQGSAFITSNTLIHTDLAAGGGPREGVMIDPLLQEIDLKTGLVMFEWHAFGHVALSESYSDPHVSSTQPWDWFHLNSISPGPDGNLLISSRNTSALYDVSMADGRVLWRIGGKNPTFKMGAGTGMAYQHDARWQPDHTITVFDDGAVPKKHSQSRAIRLAIDWAHMGVHLVGRDVRTPPILTGSQGNDQILPNGDSFVGWGEVPYFTEFSPTGQMVFDGHMPYPAQSYRAFKFPWSATPADPPAVAVKAGSAGADTVYASWNGATGVSSWRVLAGTNSKNMAVVASAPQSGFETAIPVQSTASDFAVQAIDGSGRVLGSSGTVSASG